MASNRVYASYQEIIDLHTEQDKVSVIGIHTPIGNTPLRMFKGLFEQFKKYKYKGCSISLVPAARLPADIYGVGNLAGDPNMDARDLLNPIMFHGCHGEDLGNILNRLYSIGSLKLNAGGNLQFGTDFFGSAFQFNEDNVDAIQSGLENLYYKALVDNTWKKAGPQRGFKKSGLRPLVYSLATTHQMGACIDGVYGPRGKSTTGFSFDQFKSLGEPTINEEEIYDGDGEIIMDNSPQTAGLQFITPHLTGLGYLDTKTVLQKSHSIQGPLDNETVAQIAEDFYKSYDNWTQLPLIYMGVILLPPAYKAEQYYRLIVNHRFCFKDFRGISMSNAEFQSPSYFNPDHDIMPDPMTVPDWYAGGVNNKKDEDDKPPELITRALLSSPLSDVEDVYRGCYVVDPNGIEYTVSGNSQSQTMTVNGITTYILYGGFIVGSMYVNEEREYVELAIKARTNSSSDYEVWEFSNYIAGTGYYFKDPLNNTRIVPEDKFALLYDNASSALAIRNDSLDWAGEESNVEWIISIAVEAKKWKSNVTPEVSVSGSDPENASLSDLAD